MQNNDSHSHEMQKGHNNNHKQQNPKKLCSTSFFHTIAFNWIQRINCQTRMNSHTHNFPTSTSGKCTHNTIFWLFLIRFVGREQFFFCFLLLSCVIFKTHSLENRRHCLIHSNLNHRCVKQKHTIWKRVCQSWSFFSLFRYVYSFLSTMVALLKIVLVPTNWNFSSVAFVWKHEPHNTIKFNISWMKCIQIGKISGKKIVRNGSGMNTSSSKVEFELRILFESLLSFWVHKIQITRYTERTLMTTQSWATSKKPVSKMKLSHFIDFANCWSHNKNTNEWSMHMKLSIFWIISE